MSSPNRYEILDQIIRLRLMEGEADDRITALYGVILRIVRLMEIADRAVEPDPVLRKLLDVQYEHLLKSFMDRYGYGAEL